MGSTESGRAKIESALDGSTVPIEVAKSCRDDNASQAGTSDRSTYKLAETFYDLSYFMHCRVDIDAFADACPVLSE